MNEHENTGFRLLHMDDEGAGILAYAVDDGDINEADVEGIWPRFAEAEATGNKLRIYAEMHAMPSVSGSIIVEKLKNLRSIIKTVDRFALVGDAGWLGIYTKLVDPITKADIRHFTMDQSEQAKDWIWETD